MTTELPVDKLEKLMASAGLNESARAQLRAANEASPDAAPSATPRPKGHGAARASYPRVGIVRSRE